MERLRSAGLPARWAAFDEVYGRSSALRGACEAAGLPYVAVIPRDFRVTLPSGAVIKAEGAVRDAVFERRSCGNGSKGPRYADWALAATASPRHVLLIRRLISRPDNLTFYLCWARQSAYDEDALHHHRRPQMAYWRKRSTGKDAGWDQAQARTWATCRHTAPLRSPASPRRHPQRPVRRHHPAPPPGAEEKEKEKEKEKPPTLTWHPRRARPCPARAAVPPRIGPVKLPPSPRTPG